ncbi:MAG: phenylacetate--CoA ligase family protein [Phycisphaerales bacterium]|nr:MAG: phenylacetate--CoA ligase family protein [Phycisphaerales bacterium]
MLPFVAHYVVYPFHERLLGRATFPYSRDLEESQWGSPDELRKLQRCKLRDLLTHARAKIPFYRRRLDEAGVDPATCDPFEALSSLPLLDKTEIRAGVDDMVWQDAPGGLFAYDTGGSTGEPLTFYFDRRRQGYDQAARIRTHRWFGVEVGDRELYLWGSPIETSRTDALKHLRDRLSNQLLLNAFDMSVRQMDRYLDKLESFRPVCIFGYPSSISLLAEHAQSQGRRLNLPNLRAVFVTGEVCYPHHRDIIDSVFSVPVADGYGSREVGFIAHQCPQGSFHLTAENVIVEIVDSDQPVPHGETGEIVVTHLDAYAMPFIRYRTGDVGRLKAGRCSCGRGLPLVDVIQGRTTEFLYLPDGKIMHALSIIYPLRRLRGVRRFRVTQHEDYAVTVDVVCDDGAEKITREAVAKSVRPVLGSEVDLRVQMVDRLDTVESGKHRYVVSHAKPATPAAFQEACAGV